MVTLLILDRSGGLLPVERFAGNLRCKIPFSQVADAPSSLLIPRQLWPIFIEQLEKSNKRTGVLLRRLIYSYRARFYRGEFLQAGFVNRVYQSRDQDLVKVSFRVESAVWLEFGQLAAYLGVSRCLLFVFLLEVAAHERDLNDVGIPTNNIAVYDLERPGRIHYHEYLRPGRLEVERRLQQIPSRYRDIPHYLRYEAENRMRI